MKTLPPLVIEQASNGNGTHVAFRIVHQDEKLIPRGRFYQHTDDFIFKSQGAPDYANAYGVFKDHVFLRGSVRSGDDYVIIVPSQKSKQFLQAVAELNKALSPAPRVVVFRYKTGSNPNSVHEVEVTEETSTHLKGIKRGDEGGFRSYLKKNIVGGKIVEL